MSDWHRCIDRNRWPSHNGGKVFQVQLSKRPWLALAQDEHTELWCLDGELAEMAEVKQKLADIDQF